ncbi:MAG: hypothetical protein C0592_11670, partial [Marinilabiliales bacterium]
MIYDQTEINTAGAITAIAFNVSNSPSSYITNNQTIYMTHTTASTFSTGAKPDPTSMTQVFSGSITWNGSGWATITLDVPFAYNNSDNLQIYWENNDATWSSGYPEFYYTSTSTDYKAIYKYQDSSFPTADGTMYYNRPNIRLTIPNYYNLTNGGNTTTCSGIFCDPEGTSGYNDFNGSYTHTFCSGSSDILKFDFTVFETTEAADNLAIYDGPNTGSPLIGTYSQTNSPGTVYSSGSCLTFVWTTDGNQDGDPGWEATISCTCTPLNGTYTIGGASPDYATFTDAVNALISCGVSGPVIFDVADGVYVEQINIPSISGASGTNTITFRSASANNSLVTLSNPSSTSSTDNYTLQFSDADFFIFNQITIERTGTETYGTAVSFINGASYNQVLNCRVIASSSTSTSNSAIYSTGTGQNSNYIANNDIQNGYYGIYWYGNSSTLGTDNIFYYNRITDFYYYGIYTYYQDNIIFRENTITNTSSASSTVYGLRAAYCDNDLEITKNNISLSNASTTHYGLYIYYCDGTSSNTGLIANNFISEDNSTSTSYGLYLSGSYYQNIYNNSINMNGTFSSSRCIYVSSGGNCELINNILSNTGGGYSVYFSSTTAVTTSDFNDLYTTGSALGYYSGDQADLAAWQAASGDDANSISADAEFLSITNLHTNSTNVSNLGTALGLITDDIDGEARNNPPDIGADEFDPSNNDAGVSAIVNPVTPAIIGINNIDVSVTNFGIQNLTSATVNWTVDGVPGLPYNWTGNLSTGNTDSPVTIGTYNLTGGTHTIRAWTTNPNGVADEYNPNDTTEITVLACNVMNGTYTIGGGAPDYATFQDAINAMTNCGINGPVIFNVRTGTYTEQLAIPPIPGASATNTITFQSETGVNTDVVLDYPSQSSSTDNFCVQLNDADYFTFSKITISRSGSFTYARVVEFVNNADNNSIENCRIISTNGTSTFASGIYSSITRDNNNTIVNNTISGGYYGIYWDGSTTLLEEGNLIIDNTITEFYYYGIYIQYQDGVIIEGNTIRNRSGVSTSYGIYPRYCDNDFEITKNDIHLYASSSNYCLYLYYCDGTNPNPGLVANNFITQSTGTSTTYGIYSYYTNYTNYYNNNINITGTNSSARAAYLYYGGNLEFVNNIVVNTGGGMCVYATPGTNLTDIDYNDYYWTGPDLGYYSTNQANLAAWQGATGDDANSINADPLYYTLSDLHVSAPALDGTGQNHTEVTDDIDDEVRNNPPDIGADEFVLPPLDAGISQINNPVTPATVGVNNIDITIKNFGSTNLTSADIDWEVDGVPQTTFNWAGNIATGNTNGPVTIGPAILTMGYHTIKAWTIDPNGGVDGNNYNDTCEITVFACNTMNGTYTIGGTTPDFASFNDALTAMLSCGINGPVIFDVRDGTYTEQLRIPEIPGASAVNTVTFRSESGNNTAVILNHPSSSSSTDNWGVRLDSADYIRFHEITISRSGSENYARVVEFINGANYNEITNCRIISTSVTSSSAAGIYSYTTLDDDNL